METKGQKIGVRILKVVFILVLLGASFLSGMFFAFRGTGYPFSLDQYFVNNAEVKAIPQFDGKLYAQLYSMVKDAYVEKDKIDDRKLFYGALKGMVEAIGDPYTVFFDPDTNKKFSEELKGSFEGIGAEIGMKDSRLTVIAPLANSPAEKAGLLTGDIILDIDGKDTSAMTLDDAISLIRGPAGSAVKLTVFRKDDGTNTHDIIVHRQVIVIPAVKTVYSNSIAIVSIYNFHSDSDKQFVAALQDISKHSVKGLIIDLRNNPGGFLDKSINIASAWIDPGKIVVREVYFDARLNDEHPAIPQMRAPHVPTVVLINEGSASASEILAGALQDYGSATIVGEKSYGKGSVQDVRSLPDGSGLKITIAQWLTPKGRMINKEGIHPDVVVPMSPEDVTNAKDPQLDKAKEIITKQIKP